MKKSGKKIVKHVVTQVEVFCIEMKVGDDVKNTYRVCVKRGDKASHLYKVNSEGGAIDMLDCMYVDGKLEADVSFLTFPAAYYRPVKK